MFSSSLVNVSRMLVSGFDEIIIVPSRPVLGAYRTAATAVEGSSIIFEVRRSGVQTGGCSCTWTAVSAGGTADLAAPTTGTVSFGNNVTAPVQVAVRTNNRSGTQGDRDVTFVISAGGGADLDPTRLSATTTLKDSTAPALWWQLATTRGGRTDKRASGTSYWAASGGGVTNFARYEREVGLMDAFNGGNSDKSDDTTSERFTGTTMLATGGSFTTVNANITAGSQLDWRSNDSHWTTGWKNAPKGCWCVWTVNFIGKDDRTDGKGPGQGGVPDNSVWQKIIDGTYDNAYISMGKRIKANIDGGTATNPKGHEANRLILRIMHENNQTNYYQVNPTAKLKYKAAVEKAIDLIRQGLGDYANDVKFAHAPAHGTSLPGGPLGPYESWCPSNVDIYSVSWHTTGIWSGSTLTGGINSATQVAKYMAGTDGNDPTGATESRYGPEEIAALARARSPVLPIMFPEWSPKCEWSGSGLKNACPVANLAVIAFDEFLTANQDITVCDCVYVKLSTMEMLEPNAYQGPDAGGIQQWKDMVPNFKSRWGKPNKGT